MHLAGGTLALNGGSPSVANNLITASAVGTGTFTVEGGTTITWSTGGYGMAANAMTVNGDVTFNNTAQRLTIQAPMTLGGATRKFTTVSTVTATNAIQMANVSASAVLGIRFGTSINNGPNGSANSIDSGSTLKLVGSGPWAGVGFGGTFNFNNNAGLEIGNNILTSINGALGSSASTYATVTVDAGGYFNLGTATSSANTTINSLAGAGTVCNLSTASGTATLTVAGNNSPSTTFSGQILDGAHATTDGSISSPVGVVALTLNGGTLTLSGANNYSGATTIGGGTLALNGSGSIASTPSITIASGATFDVSAVTPSGYTLTGASPQQTLSGSSTSGAATVNATGKSLSLASGALATFKAAGGASSTVGKISVTGDLNLNANAITVNVSGSALAAGTYRLLDCTGTLTGTANSTVTITGTALSMEGK